MSLIAGVAVAQQAATSSPATNPVQPAAPGVITNTAPLGQVINQQGSFGLGPLVGEPTGLGMKLWLSDRSAVDAGVAWSFVDPDGFQLHADYLFHKFDLFHIDSGQLPLYFGGGGRVKFVQHGDNRAGLRGPVGIAYLFPHQPIEVFAEVAPILDLAPTTSLEWNGGIGVRFYFH